MNASDRKTIQLYLMDGDVNGRIKCTIGSWTGVLYKIPRADLEKCKDRDHLKQTGVYFLFGTDEETGKELIYIGQAGVRKNGDGILCRLQEHKRNQEKDYWTEAVAITTTDDTFAPLEITTEENQEESQILHYKTSKVDATGRMTSDGFVLLKGSKIRIDGQASCREYISETRKKYADKISKEGILLDDIVFNSPSGAACFVLYGSVNGMEVWRNDDGKSLKQLEK